MSAEHHDALGHSCKGMSFPAGNPTDRSQFKAAGVRFCREAPDAKRCEAPPNMRYCSASLLAGTYISDLACPERALANGFKRKTDGKSNKLFTILTEVQYTWLVLVV